MPSISRVVPQVYIGDIKGAQDLDGLKKVGVTHVLQVMGGMEPVFKSQFKYKVVDIRDVASERMSPYFPQLCKWMADVVNSGGTVFVHW